MDLVKFSSGNQKLHELAEYLGIPKTHVQAFDLPAGHSCPFANICLSKVDRATGHITDGKDTQFRCYAVKAESAYPACRRMRWHNFDTIKSCKSAVEMADIIEQSLYKHVEIVRIHSSGDFFSKIYFDAWVLVAERNPEITFFGYTKGIQYVTADKPDNFKLVYSYGGKLDKKVTDEIPVSYVVPVEYEGDLPTPCDKTGAGDYFEILNGVSFALREH